MLSRIRLCNPMGCSLQGSSAHGILQARILESESESHSVVLDSLWPHGILQARILKWVAFSSPGDIPNPGVQSRSPTLQADSLPAEPRGKPKIPGVGSLSLLQRIFPTQESNWSFLHCRKILYQLSYGVHITFTWTGKSIHLYDSLYFDSHIIAVIWNWICNISEVCLYKQTHTHTQIKSVDWN